MVLCRFDELKDPGAKGFVFREESAMFSGFVLRQGDSVQGFVDSCPHAGWRLAGMGDHFLTRDDRYILCSGHGALFTLKDGECISGPCFGERLAPWPVKIEDGAVVTDAPSRYPAPPYWGGCRCGQVRFECRAEPLNVRVCHCRACQKATGSAFWARAVFPKDAVEISGRIERSASSKRLLRAFCPKCGGHIAAEPQDHPDRIAMAISALDDPNTLAPEMHIWVSEKLEWLKLDDGLPQHPHGAPA